MATDPGYERFTDRALKVMQLANQEAHRFYHEYLGTEHILLGLIKEGAGVAANVLKNLDISLREIRQEVEKIVQTGPEQVVIGRLPQTPRTKKVIEYAIEEARNLGHNYVGSEHLLLGLLREEEGVAAQVLMNMGVNLADVREEVLNLLGHDLAKEVERPASKPLPKTPALDSFGRDLTELAKQGKLGHAFGRSEELYAASQILSCRDRNSLLLVGEPGVGKTRMIESLALLGHGGAQPLRDRRLVAVNSARLCLAQRADFLAVLNEACSSGVLLILDDLGFVVDPSRNPAGAIPGNLFRAVLAQGKLQCIAATTPACYETIVRNDEFYGHHFQPLFLSPPSFEETVEILRWLRARYEAHHKVVIHDDAVTAAVRLADSWRDRCFPGKAIHLLDQAAALVRLKITTQPPTFEEFDGPMEQLSREKETAIGNQDFEKAALLRDQVDLIRKRKEMVTREWLEKMKDASATVNEEMVAEAFNRMAGCEARQIL